MSSQYRTYIQTRLDITQGDLNMAISTFWCFGFIVGLLIGHFGS